MAKFIIKDRGSLYYLRDGHGQGGFLKPPGHAEHKYSIIEKRGGHEMSSMSLSYAMERDYLPTAVREFAKNRIASNPGTITEEWIQTVYNYFRHCYSPDGINRNASDCLILKNEDHSHPIDYHLAVLFIREFDPSHQPRIDLIDKSGPMGKWHIKEA